MNQNFFPMSRFSVLALSICQLLTPAVIPFYTKKDESHFDTPITPSRYAFAIWGVITFSSFFYGLYQFFVRNKSSIIHVKVSKALCFIYALSCFWIYAATNDWVWSTVVIVGVMVLILNLLYEFLLHNLQSLCLPDKILLQGQIGLYLGWSTVAVFANLSSAFAFSSIDFENGYGYFLLLSILIIALTYSIYRIIKTNADYFVSMAIVWAFLAIYISKEQTDYTLKIIELLGLASILFTIIKIRNPFKNKKHQSK